MYKKSEYVHAMEWNVFALALSEEIAWNMLLSSEQTCLLGMPWNDWYLMETAD